MHKDTPPLLHILWDDAHIWGIIAVRAVQAMGIPFRLIKGSEVAEGLLKRERPAMILVPGGNARHKAESLGPEGIAAVRAYVASGGSYLGFCGGAGLALSDPSPKSTTAPVGLCLCPWRRGAFRERLQHFMSGHLRVSLPGREGPDAALIPPDFPARPSLPVWWPGRFAAEGGEVAVLAAYEQPGDDFWLADLPIADLPPGIFTDWRDLYGVCLTPAFLAGQPCLVHGRHGRGEYILSYSHLETPDSPDANRWLAHLMRTLGGFSPAVERIPPWTTEGDGAERPWNDPLLEEVAETLEAVREIGLKHRLLFERNDWLMGWRSGIAGANLNNLWAALRVVRETEPTEASRTFLRLKGKELSAAAVLFREGCTQYFLAERLAQTISRFMPETVSPELLKDQRAALFGPPMQAGGMYKTLVGILDELAFLHLSRP